MLNNIQVLRAAAALAVVLFHLALFEPARLFPLVAWGHFGVDLFFVISGFVMVMTIARRPVTPGRFLLNRIVRVVPLYWALTLALFVVAIALPQLLQATRAEPMQLLQSLLFVPFRKSNGLIQPVLFVGWTLNYEMFFYALFALALPIRKVGLRVGVLVAVLILLVAAGAGLRPTGTAARFYTAPIVLEFGWGMIVGLAHPWLAAAERSRWVGGAALLSGTVAGVALSSVAGSLEQQLALGPCGALIVAGAVLLEARGLRWTSPAPLLLGAASYALYLAHAFTLIGVAQIVRRLDLLTSPPGLIVAAAIGLGAALVTGVLLHLGFERPVDRWLRRRLSGTEGAPAMRPVKSSEPERRGVRRGCCAPRPRA